MIVLPVPVDGPDDPYSRFPPDSDGNEQLPHTCVGECPHVESDERAGQERCFESPWVHLWGNAPPLA
jgi:hypothetical protein